VPHFLGGCPVRPHHFASTLFARAMSENQHPLSHKLLAREHVMSLSIETFYSVNCLVTLSVKSFNAVITPHTLSRNDDFVGILKNCLLTCLRIIEYRVARSVESIPY